MIRMGMPEMNIIRSLMYGFGMVLAMHTLYRLRITKKSVFDFIISFTVYFLISFLKNNILGGQELLLLLTAIALLTINHHLKFYQAIMFSFVTLFMVTYATPVNMLLITISQNMLQAIISQDNSLYGYLAVILPGLIINGFYFLGAYITRSSIDIYRQRLSNAYTIFGLINFVFLMIVSLLIFYVISKFGPHLHLEDLYNVISYSLVGLILNPILAITLIKKIYELDIKLEQEEKDLEMTNDSRMQAYRYSHNLNNIMLTLNQLAKEDQPLEIKKYLEKIK